MPIYKVTYSSMTAHYGPTIVEAEDEAQARRLFAKGAFSQNEMGCISAREVDTEEIVRMARERKEP